MNHFIDPLDPNVLAVTKPEAAVDAAIVNRINELTERVNVLTQKAGGDSAVVDGTRVLATELSKRSKELDRQSKDALQNSQNKNLKADVKQEFVVRSEDLARQSKEFDEKSKKFSKRVEELTGKSEKPGPVGVEHRPIHVEGKDVEETFVKTAAEYKDVIFQFEKKMNETEALAEMPVPVIVNLAGAGITASDPKIDRDSPERRTSVKTRISGGTNGTDYRFVAKVTTTEGKSLEIPVTVQVRG